LKAGFPETMNFFSYLTDRWFAFLIMGIALVLFAALCAATGEAPARYPTNWVYRDEEPQRFWRRVRNYFLAGLCFIGISLIVFYFSPNPN
jgi:hypothetical protein